MNNLPGIGRYRSFGSGPSVVILSNPRADPDWWTRSVVAALTAAGYRAVTFVHTGPDPLPPAVAHDVGIFLDHLGGAPVSLLGWSQGAAIAQEVALLRPDRVAAAVLIAGYGRQNAADRVLQQASRALDAAGPEMDPVRLALVLFTSYPPAALGDDGFLEPLLATARDWYAPGSSTSDTSSPSPRDRARSFIDAYQDRLGALAGILVPCLIIGFGQDADTFVTRAREVAAAIPKSRYLELPDAGHLTPVTHSARVIEPVLDFLREVYPA